MLSLLLSGRSSTSTVTARSNYDLYFNNGKTTVKNSKKYAVFDLNINYDFNEHFTTYFKMLNFTNQDYQSLDYDHYPKRSFVGGV